MPVRSSVSSTILGSFIILLIFVFLRWKMQKNDIKTTNWIAVLWLHVFSDASVTCRLLTYVKYILLCPCLKIIHNHTLILYRLCPNRKAGLILSQLDELSPWCKGLLQEPKIGLRRMSLKFLSCRYTDTKVFGLNWSDMGQDVQKACDEQTLTVMYNDYGEPRELWRFQIWFRRQQFTIANCSICICCLKCSTLFEKAINFFNLNGSWTKHISCITVSSGL